MSSSHWHHPPHTAPSETETAEQDEEDAYTSDDSQTTTQTTTTQTRRTTQNIHTIQSTIATPPPPWDPQNRSFTSALSTIRNDPDVKAHLDRLEEMKRVGSRSEGVLADAVFTEVMAVICHAARAVCAAGERWEGEGRGEFERRMGRRARATGGFCWGPGVHGSARGMVGEGEGEGGRSSGAVDGGERSGYFSMKDRTGS